MSLPPNKRLLADMKKHSTVFIETGSYRGDAIQQALDAGFDKILSIDIDPVNIAFCKKRFDLHNVKNALRNKIELFCGDSGTDLLEILHNVKSYDGVLMWLDSHWQLIEGELPGENPFPLMDELRQIRESGVVPETILIDDILYLTHPDMYSITEHVHVSRANIEDALLDIAPYRIGYTANPVISNLLVATL